MADTLPTTPQRNKGYSLFPAVWGEDANTVIPDEPVQGSPYRNTTVTDAVIKKGQLYLGRYVSPNYNEYIYRMGSIIRDIEVWGTLPYSPEVEYKQYSRCLGSNGELYTAKHVVKGINPIEDTENIHWTKTSVSPTITLSKHWDILQNISNKGYVSIPIPYSVGSKLNANTERTYNINYEGMDLIPDIHFKEVGNIGEDSSLIQMLFPIAEGDKGLMSVVTDDLYLPDYFFDFKTGIQDPRLVVTRSTREWALDENGKYKQYEANQLAFSYDSEKQCYSAQIFGVRRRLNKEQDKIATTDSIYYVNPARGTVATAITDNTSPTGKAIKVSYTKANDTLATNSYRAYYISYKLDSVITIDDYYTFSVYVKNSSNSEIFDFTYTSTPAGGQATSQQMKVISKDNSKYIRYTGTINVVAADTDKILYVRVTTPIGDTDTFYIAGFQVERGEFVTPVIIGEGAQITVNDTVAYIPNNLIKASKLTQITCISSCKFLNKNFSNPCTPWAISTRTSTYNLEVFGQLNLLSEFGGTRLQWDNSTANNTINSLRLTVSDETANNFYYKLANVVDLQNKLLLTALNGETPQSSTAITHTDLIFNSDAVLMFYNRQSYQTLKGFLYEFKLYKRTLTSSKLEELTRL